MIVLLVTLLLLHLGYTHVPVKQVPFGESVTFKCALPNHEFKEREILWYKQRPGETLRLIFTLTVKQKQPENIKLEPEFSDSKWKINNDQEFSRLTLLSTTYDDDGVYHCAVSGWKGIEWSGTYLMVIGNRISNYTVVQQPALSNPEGSGGNATLQCSVLLDSEDMACSENISLFWFQSKSDKTYPNVIYTEGNRHDECKKRSDTERSCVFQFSRAVNSSDAGMLYCAVASCGKILFGNGTRLEIADNRGFEFTILVTAVTCLVFSLSVNIILICYQAQRANKNQFHGSEGTTSQETRHGLRWRIPDSAEGENKDFASSNFSECMKRRVGIKKKIATLETTECIYSQIKV